jgi:O-antigen ligase
VDDTGIVSLRSPEEGRLRAFGTLNSPSPFAAVLAVSLALMMSAARMAPMAYVAAAVTAVAFALTYVRSVWVGLGLALIVFVAATRSRVMVFRSAGAAVVVGAIALVGYGHPTVRAVISRVGSVAGYEDDVSAQVRFELVERTLPGAVGPDNSIGEGLGQTGIASTLGDSGAFLLADNGYLGLLYQVGPLGMALMLTTLLAVPVLAVREVLRRKPDAGLHLAILGMILVIGVFSDIFFGIVGVMLWYVAGRILASSATPRRGAIVTGSAIGPAVEPTP